MGPIHSQLGLYIRIIMGFWEGVHLPLPQANILHQVRSENQAVDDDSGEWQSKVKKELNDSLWALTLRLKQFQHEMFEFCASDVLLAVDFACSDFVITVSHPG